MKKIIKLSWLRCILWALISFACTACNNNQTDSWTDRPTITQTSLERQLRSAHIAKYDYEILETYPHAHHFTQGLVLDKHELYESSGLYKHSKLQKIDLSTGKTIQTHILAPHFFAEGIALLNNQLYQLTYREQTAFVYHKKSLALQKTFHYSGAGWGLTSDGKQLIMSNGSEVLRFVDVKTFKPSKMLTVKINNLPLTSLNELEFIQGKIYANVWPTSIIVILSPETGRVEGWLNIQALKPTHNCLSTTCVANGIAYDKRNNTLLVTGKFWPHLYRIKVTGPSG
ncbi:glutaminyl-peptide cyclotransferase [Legionella nagasakiensis]|uniref:glutaminyl-peptide cyclotransferase n=1 Tax=Legionella nagasakiensis TaxID=535290 RepID=UPI0013EFA8A9|nr:glutaminyl-peptide cyclotransferase [Legionella nagasakiensis]